MASRSQWTGYASARCWSSWVIASSRLSGSIQWRWAGEALEATGTRLVEPLWEGGREGSAKEGQVATPDLDLVRLERLREAVKREVNAELAMHQSVASIWIGRHGRHLLPLEVVQHCRDQELVNILVTSMKKTTTHRLTSMKNVAASDGQASTAMRNADTSNRRIECTAHTRSHSAPPWGAEHSAWAATASPFQRRRARQRQRRRHREQQCR